MGSTERPEVHGPDQVWQHSLQSQDNEHGLIHMLTSEHHFTHLPYGAYVDVVMSLAW